MKGRIVSDQLATDWDHRIIDGLSYAMSQTEHTLGVGDTAWLRWPSGRADLDELPQAGRAA